VSRHQPQSILISGATGAIGGALAEAYAAPGITLILQGRDRQKLDALAQRCEAEGAQVEPCRLDVREIDALRTWAASVDERLRPDLLIPAAGVNINLGGDGAGESWQAMDALLDINVRASMALVEVLLPGMRQRGRGQIALMSSLAAYFGLPITPSYCASKAAIKAYGESLRGWLAPEGIQVSVIMPGYVDSLMCREMPGPKPFQLSPQQAAAVIKRGLARNRPRISFPFPLNLGTWLLSVSHPSVAQWILARLHYHA
jgi:short-subunit dehydrogenase